MNIVLVEPEIPPNTGNIARLCAATRTGLHLIEPFGFELSDARLKRAGMDYWDHVEWRCWPDWRGFLDWAGGWDRLWLIESGATRAYHEAQFCRGDCLVFGRETAGLPRSWLERHPERWISIPMLHPQARSLNLSNCAAIVLFEALRQQGFRTISP